MHALRTNALPCEEDSDVFGDENLQMYSRYNLDLKTNKTITEINVMKLKATLVEAPRYRDQ
jgi:hypothetical protein